MIIGCQTHVLSHVDVVLVCVHVDKERLCRIQVMTKVGGRQPVDGTGTLGLKGNQTRLS